MSTPPLVHNYEAKWGRGVTEKVMHPENPILHSIYNLHTFTSIIKLNLTLILGIQKNSI